jgi:hypothetical protein
MAHAMPDASPGSGPATHYELFRGLRDARVAFLVTGAVALVLHGVPRLTPDIDLAADPDPENLERLRRRLTDWGYGDSGVATRGARDVAVRHFRHPQSALGEIDVVVPSAQEFARLRAGAAVCTLVDVDIPCVGAADLRSLKELGGSPADREDAAGLEVLAALHAGRPGEATDTRREQIRKFSRWSVAARLDWLLATARLARGMSPEARPMTRGLVRRRGWYGGR